MCSASIAFAISQMMSLSVYKKMSIKTFAPKNMSNLRVYVCEMDDLG